MDVTAIRNGGVSAIVEYDYTAKESDELDLIKGAIIYNIKQMPGGWWEGTLQSSGKTGMFPDNFVRVIDMNDENTVLLRDKSRSVNRRCKAVYSYTQVNDDELTLGVGDVIEFLGEVEEGWWRGRLKNKIGVFPSNFVRSIENSPIMASKRPSIPGAEAPTEKAPAGFATTGTGKKTTTTAKKENRLSFHNSKEDLLSSNVSSSSGKLSSAEGEPVTVPAPSLPPKPQREYCRVDFAYAPQNDDELELKVGDIIAVVSTELPDKGWWKGELNGKIGVFPDNFVKLLAPNEVAPLNDSHQQQQQPTTHIHKSTANKQQPQQSHSLLSSTSVAGSQMSGAGVGVTAAAAAPSGSLAPSATTKVFIKKSGSTSSTHSSNRKDSFGSRDSLNDILAETGLPTGNVAAQRKSLENKNLDLTNAPDASSRLGLKKQTHLTTSSATTNSSGTITTIATTISSQQQSSSSSSSMMSSSTTLTTTGAAAELRKSMENLDDKTKTTPPPMLTKKPSVPSKKTTTVTSVAGNILSGLKQKVKNVESKLTTAASHDYADGAGSSRISGSGLPDDSPTHGKVVMRRAATIAVEDSDFDRVERSSILPDMRAGRVKAPKRRPPSAAINAIGESNNNNSIYLNGSGGASSSSTELLSGGDDTKPQQHSSDDNSMSEDQLAKPKQLEFKRAPWMEELKASQVKKKTSPNVEPRSGAGATAASSHANAGSGNVGSLVAERTSKLFGDDVKIISNSSTTSSAGSTTTKVQSTMISSSVGEKKEVTTTTMTTTAVAADSAMTKSVSGRSGAEGSNAVDDARTRPNTLSIRNRSTSPGGVASARSQLKSSASPAMSGGGGISSEAQAPSGQHLNSNSSTNSSVSSTAAKTTTTTIINSNHQPHQSHQHSTTQQQHHQQHHQAHSTTTTITSAAPPSTSHENNIPTIGGKSLNNATSTTGNDVRVLELEKRVEKLESVVQTQQRAIEELMRTLREETDRVKVLRGELDKYAQCVTQV